MDTSQGDDQNCANTSLEETFYILSKKNTVYRVKLSEKGLCLQKENNGTVKTETIAIQDIIGCRCMRSKRFSKNSCSWNPTSKKCRPKVVDESSREKDEIDTSANLYIYAYVLKKCKVKSSKKRDRVVLTLRFRSYDRYEDNIKEAQKWEVTIKYLLQVHVQPSIPECFLRSAGSTIDNKLLVLVNPKSGTGKGKEIFQNKTVRLLTEADINYDLQVIAGQSEGRGFIRTQNFWKYMGGVVAVGGDGTLYEIINGIMERPDWEELLRNLRFGIIPSGSGNGLATSLSYAFGEPHDHNPVLVSSLNIVRGVASPLDLVRVETKNFIAFSILSVGWGLIAEIDIQSEVLRALGNPRYTVWSLGKLLTMRSHKGTLSFLPFDITRRDSYKSDIDGGHLNEKSRRDSFFSVSSRKSTYHSATGSSYESLTEDTVKTFGPMSVLPPLTQPVPSSWQVIKGDFVMVHAVYQTHISSTSLFAPLAKLDDGIIWIFVIKSGISRNHLTQFLLGLSNGSHVGIPGVEVYTASAFRLEPESNSSYLVVDGESVEVGPIQAEVLPSAINVFSRAR